MLFRRALTHQSCGHQDKQYEVYNKAMYYFLFLTFLVYPSVSSKLFSALPCVRHALCCAPMLRVYLPEAPCVVTVSQEDFEDGSRWLKADYSISCLDESRSQWVLFVGIMLVVYPIGIPLGYFILLYRQRRLLNPHEPVLGILPDYPGFEGAVRYVRSKNIALQSTVFLWGSYEPRVYWWEVVEMLRKMLLTGAIVFMSPGTPTQVCVHGTNVVARKLGPNLGCGAQIVAAMIITLTAIALSGFLQPFVVQVDDVIAVTCQYQLLLTLLMSLISATGVAERDGYRCVGLCDTTSELFVC